ncbi:MAG TPA: RdgB/HAM1 family non-canonical purine NTP pyrophosphatase [Terriglobales bacterium]|jgi:XTP/dITP diphosphohydrolase
MTIHIATGNQGKLRDFAGGGFARGLELLTLPGYASLPGIAETGDSFEANARLKAEHYSGFTDEWVVGDDSGLEVAALGGAPGIYSARFAGRHGDDAANNELLLARMADTPAGGRGAQFVCVLALARGGRTWATFRGTVEGELLTAARGDKGFGYDPLFLIPAVGRTMAEMEAGEKAKYSHRGKAMRALLQWIAQWPHRENQPVH